MNKEHTHSYRSLTLTSLISDFSDASILPPWSLALSYQSRLCPRPWTCLLKTQEQHTQWWRWRCSPAAPQNTQTRCDTHWTVTPSESGNRQNCQSQWSCGRCSAPQQSDVERCSDWILSGYNTDGTRVTHFSIINTLKKKKRNHCITCILNSHPHFRGTHTATAVCVSGFVQILMQSQEHVYVPNIPLLCADVNVHPK